MKFSYSVVAAFLAGFCALMAGRALAQNTSSTVPQMGRVVIMGATTQSSDAGAMSVTGSGFSTPGWSGVGTLTISIPPKMVKTSYIGVGVSDATPTLRAQLKLPDGVGLAISSVDDSGPATGIVHENDVLYKFADQIVVNYEQFAVLVRMHKPGESVELTVIREAQPVKVNVQLVEKEMPELEGKGDPTKVYKALMKLNSGTLTFPGYKLSPENPIPPAPPPVSP